MNDGVNKRPKLLAGKYEPIEPIGKGGFASVWSGFTHGEAGFRRRIAIKRVLRHAHNLGRNCGL